MNIPLTNSEIFDALLADPTNQVALAEYAQADMIILRCGLPPTSSKCQYASQPIWIHTENIRAWLKCPFCGQEYDRLLSDGTWQTSEERQRENNIQLDRTIAE